MPRPRKDEREELLSDTRQRLLQAAAVEFARKGYNGANINHISQTAGFAKGTIYNHFPSKRALMLALIDQVAAAHLDFIAQHVQAEEDLSRRLESFFVAGAAFVSEHLAQSQVMINNIYGPDAEFKQYMYQAYLPMFQFVSRDILVPGMSHGIFRQLDPAATAQLLMTIYLGTGSAVDEHGRPWLDPRLVADFALHGLHRPDRSSATEG
jgi:AcrR family transcriptional regulator